MKAKAEEYDDGYEITLGPENVKEAAVLTRMAMNATSKPAEVSVFFGKDGVVHASVLTGKRKTSLMRVEGGKCR